MTYYVTASRIYLAVGFIIPRLALVGMHNRSILFQALANGENSPEGWGGD